MLEAVLITAAVVVLYLVVGMETATHWINTAPGHITEPVREFNRQCRLRILFWPTYWIRGAFGLLSRKGE